MNDKMMMTILRQFIQLFRDRIAIHEQRLRTRNEWTETEAELQMYLHGYKAGIEDAVAIVATAMEGKKK